MAKVTPYSRFVAAFAFFGFAMFLVFLAILPLDYVPGRLPGPDLVLASTMVWVIRRPDLIPVGVVAAIFLLADFLWMRPPGLMAAAAVLGTEYLRRNETLTTEVPFLFEWTVAAALMASIVIGQATVLSILGSPTPGIGPLLVKLIWTIAVYPIMVAVARFGFGIQRRGRVQGYGYGAGL